MSIRLNSTMRAALGMLAIALLSASCASNQPACTSPQTRNLVAAMSDVQDKLMGGCQSRFDAYYDDLLTIAEGDPKSDNKRAFSEFLVWSADQGLLSTRQAEDYYNRYFNVKFMSMRGDYNKCSHTCPNKQKVLFNMERELSDKERGLLLVSVDSDSYYRADQLFKEVELVLEATCMACAAGR